MSRRRRRSVLWQCVGSVLAIAASTTPAQGVDGELSVLVTRVDDPITPVIADHLAGMVDEAEQAGHEALVVELDTPGGLDSAMRDIVQTFLAARVPVVA